MVERQSSKLAVAGSNTVIRFMDIPFFDLRISGTCPKCRTNFFFPTSNKEDVQDVTTDCNSCNAVLVIKKDRVYVLHQWLNSKDSRWPADGQDTSSMKF